LKIGLYPFLKVFKRHRFKTNNLLAHHFQLFIMPHKNQKQTSSPASGKSAPQLQQHTRLTGAESSREKGEQKRETRVRFLTRRLYENDLYERQDS